MSLFSPFVLCSSLLCTIDIVFFAVYEYLYFRLLSSFLFKPFYFYSVLSFRADVKLKTYSSLQQFTTHKATAYTYNYRQLKTVAVASTILRRKLRIVYIYFVMFVCPYVRLSICPRGITRLPMDGFLLNLIVRNFAKVRRKDSSFIRIGQEWRVFYLNTNIHFRSYLA
jgi:hypothetical protein